MRRELLNILTLVTFLSHTNALYATSNTHPNTLNPRNYVTDRTVHEAYDFVIAGGGLAGLTIASRLTETLNVTVLVLEAGETGDAVKNSINPPAGAYYKSLVGTAYDWQHKTTQQAYAGGRVMPWPRGKVLGGSSAINGMYYVRPSQTEIDTWNSLLDAHDNAPSWGWDNLHASMMKAEIFIPPSPDVQGTANIRFDSRSYGSTGNVHVSYPGFMPQVVGEWTPSLESIGIPSAADPAGGRNTGGFVSAMSINPTNWTRSYSKSAFIDPLPPRTNLDILVSSTVTRIIFNNANADGEKIASGVEFATSESGPRKVVKVNKEVILTGGALGSPKILMHSGVGPKDILDAVGIPLVAELPGVGQHLQDHLVAPVDFTSKVETAGDIEESGSDFSKQAMTMSYINSAIVYINATTLFDDVAAISSGISNALDSSASTLVPSQYPEVVEGYKAIYSATHSLLKQEVGQVELLLNLNNPGTITIQAALQHPYSHGHAYINSSSPFDPIIIDPQYFSHPDDIAILRQGIKLVRRLSQASPIRAALDVETKPGPDVSTDEQIEAWLRNAVQTEFHPQATCSMLPKKLGGVVDPNLRVYGLANVRVSDSSVFPMSFAAHLASPTYGLAQRLSDILHELYKPPTSGDTTEQDPQSTSPTNPTKIGKNAASSLYFPTKLQLITLAVSIICVFILN